MKKVLVTLIICVLVVGGVYWLVKHPEVPQDILQSGQYLMDELTSKSVAAYTNSFRVNALQPEHADYYFNTLSDGQKKIYSAFADAVSRLDTTVRLKDYEYNDANENVKDIEKAIYAFFADHPEVYYVDSKYSIETTNSVLGTKLSLKINYTVSDKATLNKQLEELDSVIKGMVAKTEGMDTINKEIALHDALSEMTAYYDYENIEDLPEETHTIYGALISKKAVCDGLGKALQLLYDRVGIENILVLGRLEKEAHAWNMVKLEGEWYNVDITSNKSVKSGDVEDIVIHSYFNVPTEQILATHTFDEQDKVPVATATKYNYYTYTGKYISINDNFSNKLTSIMQANQNPKLLEFSTEYTSNVPEKIVEVLKKDKNSVYLSTDGNKLTYYKIMNSYIIPKN